MKASLEFFEAQDLDTALYLPAHPEECILKPELSSPTKAAIDQLRFMMGEASAELLMDHVNLYNYGKTVIQNDNATLTPYGLLRGKDYQPMQVPTRQKQTVELLLAFEWYKRLSKVGKSHPHTLDCGR